MGEKTYRVVGGEIVWSDTRSLGEAQSERRAHVAAARWRAETGGISVEGVPVPTDDRAKMLVAAAASRADRNPSATFNWKIVEADGPFGELRIGFIPIDAAMVRAIRAAIEAHVQECFDREAALVGEIDSATTNEAVDAVDW